MRRPASPASRDQPGGVRVLLRADRRRRDVAAVARRRKQREAAPARADLQHAIARAAGRARSQMPRSLLTCAASSESSASSNRPRTSTSGSGRETAGRTRCRDRSARGCCGGCPRASYRAASAPPLRPGAAPTTRHGGSFEQHAAIGEHQPHQRHQVRRRPDAVHVGVAERDLPAGDDAAEERERSWISRTAA